MTDPITGALIGAGATLLGSLNVGKAKTELEAAKLIDEEDPIRRTLESFPLNTTIDARVIFANGSKARLTRVLEIGYGAARLEIQMQSTTTVRGTTSKKFGEKTFAVVRFSAVSVITVRA